MLRKLYLRHLFILTYLILSCFFSVSANPLIIKEQVNQAPQAYSYQELQKLTENQQVKQQAFEQAASGFDTELTQLQQQLNQAKKNLSISAQPIEIQVNRAYLTLDELNKQSINLANERYLLQMRQQKILPKALQDATENYKKHLSLELNPEDSQYILRTQERAYLEQLVKTLQIEQDTQNERLHLIMLRQELINRQQNQYQTYINNLNQRQKENLNEKTNQVIKDILPDDDNASSSTLMPLIRENRTLGIQLKRITRVISETTDQQQQAEKELKDLTRKLKSTEEQITWMASNTVFGENLLQSLQKIRSVPDLEELATRLANTQVNKYEYEQQQSELSQKMNLEKYQDDLLPFLTAKRELLTQLIARYTQAATEMARLQIKYESIIQVNQKLKNLINEHLFWIRNTPPINTSWFSSLSTSIHWLIHNDYWNDIHIQPSENTLWYYWMILLTLIIVIYDLVQKPYKKMLEKPSFQMNYLQKKHFSRVVKLFLSSCAYATILCIPLITAGLILTMYQANFTTGVGRALFVSSLFILFYSLYKQLSLPKGVFLNHFNLNQDFIHKLQRILFKFTCTSLPFIFLVVFTEIYDSSFIRNTLGRASFIVVCILYCSMYSKIYTSYHHTVYQRSQFKFNFLEKIVLTVIGLSPLACIILSLDGYYYSAFQILKQLHFSLLIAALFLMIYFFIRHWMIIQRRKITFEMAKKKREEYLSKKQEEGTPLSPQEELRDEILQEEQNSDLDEISKHALQLFRSLLVLSFLVSIIALWSQTQAGILYFLDEIPLWSTTTIVDGIQQTDDVTLKSVLIFLLIIGVSFLLVKNLPSLLELMILQKTTLSSANKFAITTTTRYLLIIVGVIIAFSYLGVSWSKMQWLLAALTLGLGFGIQEIFGNFFSGLMILFEKPIRIGDTVTIRDLTGTISKINIRATTIIDWDRKEVIIPNKAFITEQLINWSLSDPITRITTTISVARDSDTSLVEALLHQAIQECHYALKTPEPEIWFAGFGSHTQDYEVRAFAKQMNMRWPLRHELHNNIHKKFKENNVVIAYPQLELHVHNNKISPDGSIKG